MTLFLLFYLAIYGGAHTYLFVRTVNAFHIRSPYSLLCALLALFMVAAPVLVRVLERHEMEPPARCIAWLGYLWMGFFFLFLSASVALDLARGAAWLAGLMTHRPLWIPDAKLLLAAMLVALAASVYGLFEARHIKVEEVALRTPKIPKGVGRVRVVQLSDVHLGLMVGKERLRRILEQVAALKPDLLVCTGDLLDGQRDGLSGLSADLAALRPPLGKYAVLGNHEVYAGVLPSSSFTEEAGFRLLHQESVQLNGFLTLAGVDDPALARGKKPLDEQGVLSPLSPAGYRILLKHRPSVDRRSAGLFDLQLSGHVHKGQLFPFNLITHLAYPVKMGLSRQQDGSFLYVSRGTGTWGPPMRVLAPPEITVIDLSSSL